MVKKTTHTRINDAEDCVGKTIDGVTTRYGHALGFRFNDGTFLYLQAEDDSFGDEATLDYRCDFYDVKDAIELGVVDDAEIARFEAEQKKWRDAKDLADYEALKAKFEPK